MEPKRSGNESGEIGIDVEDMGGWLAVRLSRGQNLREDIHVQLTAALAQWFEAHPEQRMLSAMPIQRDGNTVAIHAWYEPVSLSQGSGGTPQG